MEEGVQEELGVFVAGDEEGEVVAELVGGEEAGAVGVHEVAARGGVCHLRLVGVVVALRDFGAELGGEVVDQVAGSLAAGDWEAIEEWKGQEEGLEDLALDGRLRLVHGCLRVFGCQRSVSEMPV